MKDIDLEQFGDVDFSNMNNSYFLVGLLNEFMNRFQASGDRFFKEISWKQCFLINCVDLFRHAPTISELSNLLGSSHQNIKQMLIKLEKGGYIDLLEDTEDRRKQRISLTNKAQELREHYNNSSNEFMRHLFEGVEVIDIETTIKVITQLDNNLKKANIN